jgi:hypothetical protein
MWIQAIWRLFTLLCSSSFYSLKVLEKLFMLKRQCHELMLRNSAHNFFSLHFHFSLIVLCYFNLQFFLLVRLFHPNVSE